MPQVTCTSKRDRSDPSERITHVGGPGWYKTQPAVVSEIRSGRANYWVGSGMGRVDVVVKISRYGNYYITTEPDGEAQNNLLKLPEC